MITLVEYTSYDDAETILADYILSSIEADQDVRAFICYHVPEDESCYEMVGLPTYPKDGFIGGPGFDSIYLTKNDAYKLAQEFHLNLSDESGEYDF